MHCSLYGFEPYLFHNKLPLRVCPVYSHLTGLSDIICGSPHIFVFYLGFPRCEDFHTSHGDAS